MRLREIIDSTQGLPPTASSISEDLLALGVHSGMNLLVHSSLSSLGWVCGGPRAVLMGLEKALGPHGTLMVPTHTSDLSEPAEWENPPVPAEWWSLSAAKCLPSMRA